MKPGETAKIRVVTENTGSRSTDCYMKEMKDKPGDWGGQEYQWSGTDFNPVQGGLVGNVKLHVKENDAYITLPLWNSLKTKGVYVWYDGEEVHAEAEVSRGDREIGRDSPCGNTEERRNGAGDLRLRFEVDGQSFEGGVGDCHGMIEGLKLWSPEHPWLTNFEFVKKGNRIIGELGPLLGYLPGVKVQVEEGARKVKIATVDGNGVKVQQNVFHISPPEFQSPSYAFRNGETALLKFSGVKDDFRLDSVNCKKPVSLGGGVYDVTECMRKAGEMNIFQVSGGYDSVVLETVPQDKKR